MLAGKVTDDNVRVVPDKSCIGSGMNVAAGPKLAAAVTNAGIVLLPVLLTLQ